jgi:hypothetical protein
MELIPSISIYNSLRSYNDEIILENVRISVKKLKMMDNFLSHDLLLQKLHLKNIQLKDSHVPTLISLFDRMRAVSDVSLKDNLITSLGLYHLTQCWQMINSLSSLDVSGNAISDKYMDNIAYNLSNMKKLKSLDLSHNHLTTLSIKSITLYFTTHSCRLTSLNLSYNNLGDGAAAIASILMRIEPSIIESIDVSFCNLASVGIIELTNALPFAKSLKLLNIRGSFINTRAEVDFMKAITEHRRLYRRLKMPLSSENHIDAETIQVTIGGVGLGSDTITNQLSELKSLKFSLPYIDIHTLMKSVVLQRRWINPIYSALSSHDMNNHPGILTSSDGTMRRQSIKVGESPIATAEVAETGKTKASLLSSSQQLAGNSFMEFYNSAAVLVDQFYQPLPSPPPSPSAKSLKRGRSTDQPLSHQDGSNKSTRGKAAAYETIQKFVYMKVKFPNYISSEHDFLLFLAQTLHCDPCQLKLMTTYQASSGNFPDSIYDVDSTCLAFAIIDIEESDLDRLHHRIVSRACTLLSSPHELSEYLVHEDYHDAPRYRLASDTILHNIKALSLSSDISLRLLGIQTVYLQFPCAESINKTSPPRYQVMHCHIDGSCHTSLPSQYEYFPIIHPQKEYLEKCISQSFDLDTDDEIDEHDEHDDPTRPYQPRPSDAIKDSGSNQQADVSMSKLSEFAKRKQEELIIRARERASRRQTDEQIIRAVRQMYREMLISSTKAKFWEGAFGNKKANRQRCLHSLLGAIDARNLELDASSEEITREDLSTGVFIAVSKRCDLLDAMFRRDISAMTAWLTTDRSEQSTMNLSDYIVNANIHGIIVLLAERLLNELLSLQDDAKSLSSIASSPEQISFVEEFLLSCGKVGYSGPEMIESISFRQQLLSQLLSMNKQGAYVLPKEFIATTKHKAMLSNLMISRDMEGLKSCLEKITGDALNYETYRYLPEFIAAKEMLSDYARCISQLRDAMEKESLEDLEDALASMAYGNYAMNDLVTRGLKELLDVGSDPKLRLLNPVMEAIRKNDLAMTNVAIERCSRAGWSHPALHLSLIKSIIETRKRMIDEESFRSDIVKIALAIKNNMVTANGQIANIWRRINASPEVKKDNNLRQYILIIEKQMRKQTDFAKLDADIQFMIENNDVEGLCDLVAGFGSYRLVINMSTEAILNEWLDKLTDCSNGVITRGAKTIEESDPAYTDTVILTGSFEKLARSDVGKNRSWKLRYFVLKGQWLHYYTSQNGELKGSVRVRNGSIRIMDPSEVDGKKYCIEILEGLDLQSIDPILFSQAKRIVSLGKKSDVENIIRLGIKAQSIASIEQGYAEAKLYHVEVDESIDREARSCMHALRTKDIKRSLHLASIEVPIAYLPEIIATAEKLYFDPGNSLLQSIRRLSEKSELQQLIIRMRGGVISSNDYLVRKTFHALTKYDRKQFTSQDRGAFIAVVIQYISYQCYRSYLDAESFRSIVKQLRHAIACCLSFHIETEAIQLANLVAKQKLLSSGQQTASAAMMAAATSIQASTTTILQLFDDQRYSQYLHPQYSIEKYPHLRVKSTQKGSGLMSLFVKSSSTASSNNLNTQIAVMMYSDTKIKKSLLSDEIILTNDQNILIKAFDKLLIVMKNLSADAASHAADLIKFGTSNSRFADELYLQLCKQLTGNPSSSSRLQGWCLFSIYLHSFPMSYDLIPYLKNFISYAAGAESATISITSARATSPASADAAVDSPTDQVADAEVIDSIVQIASYCTKLLNKIEQGFVTNSSTTNPSGVASASASAMVSTTIFTPLSSSVITRILSRQSVSFEVLLMTGSLYRFEVRYGEVDTPLTILSMLYTRMIGGGRVLKALSEYYGLRRNVSKSPNLWMDFLLKQFRGMMFYLDEGSDIKSFGMKSSVTNTMDELPGQADDMHRLEWNHDFIWDLFLATNLPRSGSIDQYGNPEERSPADTRVRRLSQIMQGSVPRLILRKTIATSNELFANQFELFDDQVSERDTRAARGLWIDWLANAVTSSKPLPSDFLRVDLLFAEESRIVNSRLYPMANESLHYLLAMQIALNWEDETNAINHPEEWGRDSCDSVLPASHLQHQVGFDLSIRPAYRTSPASNIYRAHSMNYYSGRDSLTVVQTSNSRRSTVSTNRKANQRAGAGKASRISVSKILPYSNQRISRFFRKSVVGGSDIDRVSKAIRRQSLKKEETSLASITEATGDEHALDEDEELGEEMDEDYYYDDLTDEDDAQAASPPASPRSTKKASSYSSSKPMRSSSSKKSVTTSDDDDDDEDANILSSDDEDETLFSSDSDSEDEIDEKLRIGALLTDIKSISSYQLDGLRRRLVKMGVLQPNNATSMSAEEQNIVDGVVANLVNIHQMILTLNLSRQATSTSRFRYFLKRAYLEYLMTNPFYGHHFTSSSLQPLIYPSGKLDASGNQAMHVIKRELDLVVAISPHGFYLLDPTYWQLIFSSPLWDIEDIQILEPGTSVQAINASAMTSAEIEIFKERKSLNKTIIVSAASLKICINGINIVISSDADIVQEQYRILHQSIFEAVSHGIFPHGSSSESNLNALSVHEHLDKKEAVKRFLRDFPLLPIPPAMINYQRNANLYFEAPRSRREELAAERALEEAKELEQSRLAAQQAMEKLEKEMEKGRVTVMSRYQVEDDAEDADAAADQSSSTTTSPKLKKRLHTTAMDDGQALSAAMRMTNDMLKRRIDAAVAGVPTKTSSQLYTMPAIPIRKAAALRVVESLESIKTHAGKLPSLSELVAKDRPYLRSHAEEQLDEDAAEEDLASAETEEIAWPKDMLSYRERWDQVQEIEYKAWSLIYHQPDTQGEEEEETSPTPTPAYDEYPPCGGILKGKSLDLVKRLKLSKSQSNVEEGAEA